MLTIGQDIGNVFCTEYTTKWAKKNPPSYSACHRPASWALSGVGVIFCWLSKTAERVESSSNEQSEKRHLQVKILDRVKLQCFSIRLTCLSMSLRNKSSTNFCIASKSMIILGNLSWRNGEEAFSSRCILISIVVVASLMCISTYHLRPHQGLHFQALVRNIW